MCERANVLTKGGKEIIHPHPLGCSTSLVPFLIEMELIHLPEEFGAPASSPRRRALACFDPEWPRLIFAVARFVPPEIVNKWFALWNFLAHSLTITARIVALICDENAL